VLLELSAREKVLALFGNLVAVPVKTLSYIMKNPNVWKDCVAQAHPDPSGSKKTQWVAEG
jgi:hypothetical protein